MQEPPPPPSQGPGQSSSADLSAELVGRIQDGDASAWEDLYLRYRDPLLLSIRCRVGPALRSRLASEDLLHSVVADALGDLERFEPRGPGSLNRFLHVCVLNKIRNKAAFFAAQKRQGATPLTDSLLDRLPGAANEPPGYLDSERYERLERSLAQLPDEMREVLLLRRVEGLSNVEAAGVLGKTPAATSKLCNRALARLGILMGAVGE